MEWKALKCINCGAALESGTGGIIKCPFCGTVHSLLGDLTTLKIIDVDKTAAELVEKILAGAQAEKEAACLDIQKIHDARVIKHIIHALSEIRKQSQYYGSVEGSKIYNLLTDAIIQIGDKSAVGPLIELLRDPSGFLQQIAAYALEKLGDTKAAGPLRESLKSPDRFVRAAAAGALGGVGDHSAVDLLLQALKDESVSVIYSAARALGILKAERAVKPLMDIAKNKKYDLPDKFGDHSNLRPTVLGALGEIGADEPVDMLIKLMKDENANVRREANYALKKIGKMTKSKQMKAKIDRIVI